mmetsp:Transcript_39036/g.84145  ORF Transcript_39036/g.84145 Transcript_39036/m.84145 type:complete len:207 (+) Transcript_39036:1743-2363(+)
MLVVKLSQQGPHFLTTSRTHEGRQQKVERVSIWFQIRIRNEFVNETDGGLVAVRSEGTSYSSIIRQHIGLDPTFFHAPQARLCDEGRVVIVPALLGRFGALRGRVEDGVVRVPVRIPRQGKPRACHVPFEQIESLIEILFRRGRRGRSSTGRIRRQTGKVKVRPIVHDGGGGGREWRFVHSGIAQRGQMHIEGHHIDTHPILRSLR